MDSSQTQASKKSNIILIHGLFMPGVVMIRLRKFFEDKGFSTTIFSYHTTTQEIDKSANALKSLIESLGDDNIIVCHSLGGLLTQKTLARLENPAQKVQKVISLGTPWQGASIVTFMHQYKMDAIVGKSLEILLPKDNQWQFPDIKLGSIAGRSSFGTRMLLAPGKIAGTDGTVAIEETKIAGMTAHTIIPIGHTGLMFSNLCAKKILQFIETDSFE